MTAAILRQLFCFLLISMAQLSVANSNGNSLQKSSTEDLSSFKVRIANDPKTLDWNKLLDVASEQVIYQFMEGLVSLSSEDEVQPALASSWSFSKDKKTITFKIRKDVRWSDGKPLTAQHFVDSWERLLNPTTGALGGFLLYEINNAEDYHRGKVTDRKLLGFSAPDESTLKVTLKFPAKYFLAIFDHPITFPVRKDLIEQFGDSWSTPKNLVTLGPYKVTRWQSGKSVEFEANDRYYGKAPKYKAVQFLVVQEDVTALNLFEKGQVDLIYNLPSQLIDKSLDKYKFKRFPQINNSYLTFNSKAKPFDDVRVRKAFIHAFDSTDVTKVVGGDRQASHSWIPQGVFGNNEETGLKFDPELAKKFLREAGYPDGKGFPPVTFIVNQSEDNRIMAERAQNMWTKNLNVQVNLEMMDWPSYLNRVRTNPPEIFRFGVGMVSKDPHLFMSAFAKGSALNSSGFQNDEYDSLIYKGVLLNERNSKARQAIYDDAQRLLLQREAAIAPLFQFNLRALMSPRAESIKFNGRGKFLISEIH